MARSWKLINVTGVDQHEVGKMDLVWQNGSPEELTDPFLVLDQRIQKATVEPRGSNRNEPRWGSSFKALIGRKLMGETTLREVSDSLAAMVNGLISIDQDVVNRLSLEPGEQIVAVLGVRLSADGTGLLANVMVQTAAATRTVGVRL